MARFDVFAEDVTLTNLYPFLKSLIKIAEIVFEELY